MGRISGFLLLTLFSLSIQACSAPVRPAEPISTDASTCIDRYAPGQTALAPTVDYSGTWAREAVRTSVSSPPLIGDVTTTVTSLARIEISQEGQDLDLTVEVCDIQAVTDNDSARTELPEAFITSVPIMERSATVVAIEGGHMFFSEDHAQVRGAQLSDAQTEPLPVDEDDVRLLDPDGDGHPGLTIRVFGVVDGEMYIVQRIRTSLCGLSTDANRIDGLLEWRLDQVTVDASSFMLDRQTETEPHVDPERHYFRTTRVEPNTTCQDIKERAEQIFAR